MTAPSARLLEVSDVPIEVTGEPTAGSSTLTMLKPRRGPTSERGRRNSIRYPPGTSRKMAWMRGSEICSPSADKRETDALPVPRASTAKRRNSSSGVTTAISR